MSQRSSPQVPGSPARNYAVLGSSYARMGSPKLSNISRDTVRFCWSLAVYIITSIDQRKSQRLKDSESPRYPHVSVVPEKSRSHEASGPDYVQLAAVCFVLY